LQTNVLIAHIAVYLALWSKSSDAINYDKIDRTASCERLNDLKCLLAKVRLRDVKVVGIYA